VLNSWTGPPALNPSRATVVGFVLPPALAAAKSQDGPTVVCLRTDRDANLSIPQEMLLRFMEVYQGPIG